MATRAVPQPTEAPTDPAAAAARLVHTLDFLRATLECDAILLKRANVGWHLRPSLNAAQEAQALAAILAQHHRPSARRLRP